MLLANNKKHHYSKFLIEVNLIHSPPNGRAFTDPTPKRTTCNSSQHEIISRPQTITVRMGLEAALKVLISCPILTIIAESYVCNNK